MTKQEFIEKLAKKAKISKKDARTIVDAALGLIIDRVKRKEKVTLTGDRVKRKEKVTLTGFGTFEARQQKATQRINPQTGRKMTVPAKLVPFGVYEGRAATTWSQRRGTAFSSSSSNTCRTASCRAQAPSVSGTPGSAPRMKSRNSLIPSQPSSGTSTTSSSSRRTAKPCSASSRSYWAVLSGRRAITRSRVGRSPRSRFKSFRARVIHLK